MEKSSSSSIFTDSRPRAQQLEQGRSPLAKYSPRNPARNNGLFRCPVKGRTHKLVTTPRTCHSDLCVFNSTPPFHFPPFACAMAGVAWWVRLFAPLLRRTRLLLFFVLVALSTTEVCLEHLLGNSHVVDHGDIYDAGFIFTKSWHAVLAQRQDLVDFFSICSSVSITIFTAIGAFYFCLYQRHFGLGITMYLVLLGRSFTAACTSLPRSNEYLYSVYDVPNAVSDHFIFLYSGHAANLAFFGHWLWTQKLYAFASIVHVTHALQWVFLITTRGHYTADLIIGAIIGAYAATWEPHVTAYLQRLERRVKSQLTAMDAGEPVPPAASLPGRATTRSGSKLASTMAQTHAHDD